MKPQAAATILETINHLVDRRQQLLNWRLANLSDLKPAELAELEKVWPKLTAKRRRQIVSRLVELAEDNVELNFDGIFKSLLTDPDEEVRNQAIGGLWEDEAPSLIEPLARLLEQDSSTRVRAAAATTLAKFALLAEHQKLPASAAARVHQALLGIIGDDRQPAEVRRRALEAAAPLGLPQVAKTIRAAYCGHNAKLKISAIYAMGKSCDPCWLAILLDELTSANAEMRYEAATACGELEAEAAVPHLSRLIDDADTEVQLAAIQALGKIGGNEAKKGLKRCLNHPREVIRQMAEQALEELEDMEEPLSFGL